jgi:hypothetical protein
MEKHKRALPNKYWPALLIILFIGQGLFAQDRPYRQIPDNTEQPRHISDSTEHIPFGTTPSLRGGLNRGAAIFYRLTDSSLYIYDGTHWVKTATPSPGASYFANLLDVDTSGIFNGAGARYNTSTGKWEMANDSIHIRVVPPLFAVDDTTFALPEVGPENSGYATPALYDSILSAKRYGYVTNNGFGQDSIHLVNGKGEDTVLYVVNVAVADGWVVVPAVNYSGTPYVYDIGPGGIFRKNGIYYNVASTTITIDSANATNPRTDVIAADTSGNAVYIPGTPDPDPVKPTVDVSFQIEITHLDVPSGVGATPVIDTTFIYKNHEAGNWTIGQLGTTFDADNTLAGTVFEGTKSINVTNINNGDQINFTHTATDISGFTSLNGYIKLKAAMPTTGNINVVFLSSGVTVSSSRVIPLNKANTTTFQAFGLNLSTFGLTTNLITEIRFFYTNTAGTTNYNGFYADYIYFQRGIPATPPASTYTAGIDMIINGQVINADTTTGATKLATQGDIIRAATRFGVEDIIAAQNRNFNLRGTYQLNIDSASIFNITARDGSGFSSNFFIQPVSIGMSTQLGSDISSLAVSINQIHLIPNVGGHVRIDNVPVVSTDSYISTFNSFGDISKIPLDSLAAGVVSAIPVNNGLSKSGDTVQIGGYLTKPITKILGQQSGSSTEFDFDSLQYFTVHALPTAGPYQYQAVVNLASAGFLSYNRGVAGPAYADSGANMGVLGNQAALGAFNNVTFAATGISAFPDSMMLIGFGVGTHFTGTELYGLGVDGYGRIVETNATGSAISDSIAAHAAAAQDLQSVTTVGNSTDQDILISSGTSYPQLTVRRTGFTNAPQTSMYIQSTLKRPGIFEVSDTTGSSTKYTLDNIINSSARTLHLPIGVGLDTLALLSDIRGGIAGSGSITGTTDNLLKVTGANLNTNKTFAVLTYSATPTWNLTTGYNKTLALTGNAVVSFSNVQSGDGITLIASQDATGSRTLTIGGNVISIDPTGNAVTVVGCIYNGTDWICSSSYNTYITGNQTVTLSGDVTGSGATAITTTIANSAITNAKVSASAAIAYSKLNLTGAILNADLAGSIALSKLTITGTPDGTKFLRDDGSWQTVTSGFSNPMTTLGDITYEDATPAAARLAGNTTTTKKFLRQTGNGTISAAPAWDVLVAGDIPDISATYQPLDADLTSLAGNSTNGVLAHTASGTITARTITGTSNEITVTNGDGVSGAPTISLPSTLALTGKAMTVQDNNWTMQDDGDNTKLLKFQLSSIATATTRTATWPDANITVARSDAAQTFTGVQTFSSAPVFSTGTATVNSITANVMTKQVNSVSSNSATPVDGASVNIYEITASASLTVNAPSGTQHDGDELYLLIEGGGTARSITFNAIYSPSPDVPLPTTTVVNKLMALKFVYTTMGSRNKYLFFGYVNNYP